jgi:hypothetical protein|tara:strand:- start:284 stop:418 length:135 start_codon:yes stop_codon:yes gene_type:complete
MIDRLIEMRKEFGLFGTAFILLSGAGVILWYAVEIVKFFNKYLM